MQFSIALLGTFHTSIDGRSITDFATDKTRALLAYLALLPDRPHRREVLSSLLWSEWPDDLALRNLRKTLHRLRQTVDRSSPGGSAALFDITRQTILLRSDNLCVDVAEFRDLLASVERHQHPTLHTCQTCLNALERAVELYQGELLAGFEMDGASLFDDWLERQRDHLQAQLTSSLYTLAEVYRQRGEHERAQGYAARQIALDRWNEDAHRQMILALALSGQQSEALAYYDDYRIRLAREFDAEPQPKTVELYQNIRDSMLVPNGIHTTLLHNFPIPFTPFIGRQSELQTIQDYLLDDRVRLVTLLGPSGIGKTRLCIEATKNLVAQRNPFGDGIYFVALVHVTDANGLWTELALALELALHKQSAPREQVLAYLQRRRCLLVLDNFEHLDAHVSLLSEILTLAPDVQLLVTTHAPLRLQAEQRIFVGSLAYPQETDRVTEIMNYSAVQLFVETAKRIHPGFSPDCEEYEHIVAICRLVHGIPIALEIAAAWVHVHTCKQIVQQIAQGLGFLVTPLQDVPARHRSMLTVFEHSWDLLSPVQQKMLAQISVFEGEFSSDAVLTVTGESFVDFITLVERTLLVRTSIDSYKQHQLLRDFAAGKLQQWDAGGENLFELTHQRHSLYYLQLAADHEELLQSPQAEATVRKLEHMLTNIRKAWRWGLNHNQWEAIAESADSLAHMADLAGRFHNAERILEHALIRLKADIDREGETAVTLLTMFRLLFWHAHFLNQLGYTEQAISDARQAITLSEKLDPDTYAVLEETIRNKLMPIATHSVYLGTFGAPSRNGA